MVTVIGAVAALADPDLVAAVPPAAPLAVAAGA